MTPLQALQMLDAAVATISLPRQSHLNLNAASSLLSRELELKEQLELKLGAAHREIDALRASLDEAEGVADARTPLATGFAGKADVEPEERVEA